MLAAHLRTALLMSVPLIVSGSIHMAFVRRGWLGALARPIHARWFGENKTWRGVVVMMLASIPGVAAAQALEGLITAPLTTSLRSAGALGLGACLGLGYVLAELPNSYVKRRMGIRPGMLPPRHAALFVFVDQADSAIGCAVAYALWLRVPAATLLLACLLGPVVHLIANVTLFLVGLRRRPV
jgi:CDP-diacylglycerol--serine O-phosphatidyltransferase